MQRRQERRGGHQLYLLDTSDLAQGIAQGRQPPGRALDQQYLERLIIFEQYVLRGDHLFYVSRFRLRQGMANAPAV